jgi:8-oxo-dGTP pyrophosphatase MutT (NUDIX family)
MQSITSTLQNTNLDDKEAVVQLGNIMQQEYWKIYDDPEVPAEKKAKSLGEYIRSTYSFDAEQFINRYNEYLRDIPVAGFLITDDLLTRILLVRNYGFKKWSPPKGKIEKGEDPLEAAIRECREECGLDISHLDNYRDRITGPLSKQRMKFSLEKESYFYHLKLKCGEIDQLTLEPQVTNEIAEVQWHLLDNQLLKRANNNIYIIQYIHNVLEGGETPKLLPVRSEDITLPP